MSQDGDYPASDDNAPAVETLPYAAPPDPDRADASGGATLFHLASLGLKLLGIYTLSLLAPFLAMIPTLLIEWRSPDWQQMLGVGFVVLAYLAVGAFLIACSRPLAARLTGRASDHAVLSGRGAAAGIQAVAFSVVGGYMAVSALPRLGGLVWEWFRDRERYGGRIIDGGVPFDAIETLGQLAIGVWLFFGSRGLAALWRRFQERGDRKPPPPRESPSTPTPPPPAYRGPG